MQVYLCVFMYVFACELEHAQVCVCVYIYNHLEVSHDPTVCIDNRC